jgi:hypothetical protein
LGSLANSEGSESRGIHFHLQRNSRQRWKDDRTMWS